MKKYSSILLDLFDTILNFNFNHLPTVELKGFRSRTTSKEVYETFRQYYPEIGFEEFYDPFMESYHEFQELKLKEFREFPNRNRFILMLDKMNIESNSDRNTLIDKMVIAHMKALASCIEYPEENNDTLEYLKAKGYRLALVSNFDFAPTAQMLIDKHHLRPFFETIVISSDVGWRKPKDIIFETAMNELNIGPEEALFVGDNYSADVIGSKALGMDAAWINRRGEPETDINPEPDIIIKRLSELGDYI